MQSVFAQNFAGIEYIVIDGGSTDGSKEYIEQNSDKLAYWISEKDTGIYAAMNKGIMAAKGELIIFLNSGDYYVSDNLFLYAKNRIDINKADLFFCQFIWDSPKANVIAVSDSNRNLFDWHLMNSNFPHPATFYKRRLFSRIGLFDESFKILGDFDWNARALIKSRVSFQYVNLVTVFFRADGVSNQSSHKDLYEKEISRIFSAYFDPAWLHKWANKYDNLLVQKFLAKVFKKRMNRVY